MPERLYRLQNQQDGEPRAACQDQVICVQRSEPEDALRRGQKVCFGVQF